MSSTPVDMDLEFTPPSDSVTPTFSQLMDIDHADLSDTASDTSSDLSSLDTCPPTPDVFLDNEYEYPEPAQSPEDQSTPRITLHPRHLDASRWLTPEEQELWRSGQWRDENQQPGIARSSPVMQTTEDENASVPMLGNSDFTWYTPPVRARRLFRYPASWRFVPVTHRGPGNHGSESYIMFDRQTNTLCHGKTVVEHTNQNLFQGAWWSELNHPHIIQHRGWLGCFHRRHCWNLSGDPHVRCHSHPRAPEVPMRMTELAELGPLTEEIKSTLTGRQVLEIVRQIASALKFLHKNRIVHTDVKPSKILVRSLDPVNVALDLSTSTHVHDGNGPYFSKGVPGRLGTPGWQSRMTEQLGQTYGFWDDLWPLGSLILWLTAKPYKKLQQWDWRAQRYYAMELGRLNEQDKLIREVMVLLINPQPNGKRGRIIEAKEVQKRVSAMLRDGVYGDEKIILDNNVESFPEYHEYQAYKVLRE